MYRRSDLPEEYPSLLGTGITAPRGRSHNGAEKRVLELHVIGLIVLRFLDGF